MICIALVILTEFALILAALMISVLIILERLAGSEPKKFKRGLHVVD